MRTKVYRTHLIKFFFLPKTVNIRKGRCSFNYMLCNKSPYIISKDSRGSCNA